MNKTQLLNLTRTLMDQHGLTNWKIRIGSAKNQAGVCDYRKKTIGMSLHLAGIRTVDETKDTILHEIAHALAGHSAGHGPKWKTVCRQIGANPERTFQLDKPIEHRFEYHCPSHPDVKGRCHRRRAYVCNRCHSAIVFYDHKNPQLGYQPYAPTPRVGSLEWARQAAQSLGALTTHSDYYDAPRGYVWAATDTHGIDGSVEYYEDNPKSLANDIQEGFTPCTDPHCYNCLDNPEPFQINA